MRRLLFNAVLAVCLVGPAVPLLGQIQSGRDRAIVGLLVGVPALVCLWRPALGLGLALAEGAFVAAVANRPVLFLGCALAICSLVLLRVRKPLVRVAAVLVFAVGMSFITGRPLLVVAGLALLASVQLALDAAFWRGLRQEVVALDGAGVMAGAEQTVAGFEVLGFRQVGAFRFRVGKVEPIATVLSNEEGTIAVTVTDLTVEVDSAFGHRRLETSTTAAGPQAPRYLRQHLADGSPAELVDLHVRALRVLAESGVVPDALTGPEWVEALRTDNEVSTHELAATPWETAVRVHLGLVGDNRPLRGHPNAEERVRRWLDAPPASRFMRQQS